MATQTVRNGLAAGFSLDEIRQSAASEYRDGISAGFSRAEMDQYIAEEYGFKFSYNHDAPDDALELSEWMAISKDDSTKASVDEQISSLAKEDRQAQRAAKIANEWAQMDSNTFMRRGTRSFTDTELADESLYKMRDSVIYKPEVHEGNNNGFFTGQSDDFYTEMRKQGVRPMTPADRSRQDELLKEGAFKLTPEPTVIRATTPGERLQQTLWKDARPAQGIAEHFNSGFQSSVTGLWARGAAPNLLVSEQSSFTDKLASTMGTMIGDLPTFVPGAIAGGVASAETVVGVPAGAAAGGMALTEGVKKTLMLRYTQGEVKDFSDFMDRTGQITWATTKGGVTGLAGGYIGGRVVGPIASGLTRMGVSEGSSMMLAEGVARPVAEIGAFTTAGAALNGHVPTAEDFLLGVGAWGLMKTGGFYTSKLRDTYVRTDVTPKALVKYMERDVSVKEDIMSANNNVPRSLGGDFRPAYAITREVLPENMAEYSGKPMWLRLSKNEADMVVTGINKKNGFAEDGSYTAPVRKAGKGQEQLSLLDVGKENETAVQPQPHSAVPFAIRSDAPLLWLKSASDPNIGRLYRQFAEETKPELFDGIRAGEFASVQRRGYEMFKNPTPEFLSWLQTGRGRVGVKEEQALSSIEGMRLGDQVMLFDPKQILPSTTIESPAKSLAYSVDTIAESLSVNELPADTGKQWIQKAYQQVSDKFQPLNDPAPIGQMTPAYLMARLYPGTDGLFMHWMEHGRTMFGRVSSYGAEGGTRQVTGKGYASILSEATKANHELKKGILGKDDQAALSLFREAFRENDRLTVTEIKSELSSRLSSGEMSKKAYDAAIKRLEKDFSAEVDLAKYGENDPLFFFRTYVTAKHISNLADRGVIAGPDIAAAKSIANSKLFQQYLEPAAQEYYAYNKALTQYRYDAGLITKKQMENMHLQNPYYVPMNRVIEGQGEYVSTGTFSLKGSARKIIDPLESTIRQTQHTLKQAERNQVLRLIAEQFGEPVRTSKDPNTGATVASLAKMDATEAKVQSAGKANTIVYKEHGVEKMAVVPPIIAKTAGLLDPVSSNVLLGLAGQLTSINRAGIILHPAFALRNLTRDQFTAAINSSADVKPWFGFLRGLADVTVSDKNGVRSKLFPGAENYHAEWMRHSGAISNLVSQNRKYSQEMITKLLATNNVVNSVPLTEQAVSMVAKYINPLNIGKAGYKGLQRLAEVSEEGTRMGEYIALRQKGVHPMEAAMRAREVTIDFARSGAAIKGLNAISLFLNAKIQGADRSVRQIIANPQETATRTMAYIVVPTIMLAMVRNDYMHNSADSEVAKQLRQIPDWQKQNYWIVPSEAGIFRIPKPQELGIPLANPVESFIDYIYDKSSDKSFLVRLFNEGYFGTVADQFFLTPDSWKQAVMPSALGHIAAVGYNMDPFTNTPIIPPNQEKLLPEARYNRSTTELAKRMSYLMKGLDSLFDSNYSQRFRSPQSVDYLVQAYGGTIGKELWQLIDTAAQKSGVIDEVTKPANRLEDNFFINAFMVKYPDAGAKSITKFYTEADKMEQTLNTIKAYMKEGTASAADRAKLLMIEGNYGRLTQFRTTMGTISQNIRKITLMDGISAEDKRRMIDGMYIQMIEIADQGLQVINAFEKAAEQRRKHYLGD